MAGRRAPAASSMMRACWVDRNGEFSTFRPATRSWRAAAKAASICAGVLAKAACSTNPSERPAASTDAMLTTEFGSPRLSTALPLGNSEASSSSRLALSGPSSMLMPVTRPPGRLSCAACPAATRSPSEMTGNSAWATIAAFVAAAPVAMNSAGSSAASSAARRGSSCTRPPVWRMSMITSWPSTCPRSRKPSRRPCKEPANAASLDTVSTARRRGALGLCAKACGAARPPPRTSMSMRRFIAAPRRPAPARPVAASGPALPQCAR